MVEYYLSKNIFFIATSFVAIDTPPNSLKDSNASLKMKLIEEEKIVVYYLAHRTSMVKGACQGSRMRTRTNDKKVNYSYGHA
jgi:hypothetical protein